MTPETNINVRGGETITKRAPLYVDLDGTLHASDLLFESFAALIRQKPWLVLLVPFWVLRGRAYLKARLAATATVDVKGLPYRQDFVDYLRAESGSRRIVLATAANENLAQSVAAHLGLFDAVLASSTGRNLKAEAKAAAIAEHAGGKPFVYSGNDAADFPVWQRAAGAVVVNASAATAQRARMLTKIEAEFPAPARGLRAYIRAIRAYQWAKNGLVFVPLITAHLLLNATAWINSALAFAAFSLVASSIYVLNDIVDLPADRRHPRKKARPFASGLVPISHGLVLIPLLLVAGFAFAWQLGTEFKLILAAYLAVTCAYSIRLKEYVLIDVGILAALYTVRVIGGAAAIGVPISFWLLAFSVFLFFSLALIKRCSEIHTLAQRSQAAAHGRDYGVSDLAILQSVGVASGFAAIMVFALFINSPEVAQHYEHPRRLWLLCGTLMYWIARMWVKTARGEMRDDPLIYAARDKGSLVMLGATILILLASI